MHFDEEKTVSDIQANKDLESVSLTENALNQALKMRGDNSEWTGMALRLYLDGKGCDGFYYGVSFDQKAPKDYVLNLGELDLVVDDDTYEFVTGSIIDWIDDERGQGFLVDNPNHRKFRGKFYKRQAWQDKLTAKKS
jgi:iron-sulfur cluster insertion protein